MLAENLFSDLNLQELVTESAAVPLGLSLLHTLPGKTALPGPDGPPPGFDRLLIASGGACIRIQSEKRPVRKADPEQSWFDEPEAPAVKRGRIRGMSRGSRLRQLQFVNSIDRTKIKRVLFMSQTLRGGVGCGVVESWELIEQARRKWFKRLERFLASYRWFAMWRKEPHVSGVAHLHVLVFFLDKVPHLVREFRPWNDKAWAQSVGDPSIEPTACKTELLRTWGGVASYLCKYLAKEQELQGIETGKVWDVVHRDEVPVDFSQEDVQKGVGGKVRRHLRKWQQRKAETWELWGQKDGVYRWLKIWPQRRGNRFIAAWELAEQAKVAGLRVRRRRPRLCYTMSQTIFAEVLVETSQGTKRDIEPVGEEKTTYFAGRYFVPEADARKLVEICKRNYVDDLLQEESLPC